jgi:hypothetical protein
VTRVRDGKKRERERCIPVHVTRVRDGKKRERERCIPVHVTRVRDGKKRERERCIPVRQCRPRKEWDKEIKTGPYLLSVSPSLSLLLAEEEEEEVVPSVSGPSSPPLSQLLSLPRFDAAGVI